MVLHPASQQTGRCSIERALAATNVVRVVGGGSISPVDCYATLVRDSNGAAGIRRAEGGTHD